MKGREIGGVLWVGKRGWVKDGEKGQVNGGGKGGVLTVGKRGQVKEGEK